MELAKTYMVNTIYPAFMGEVNMYGIGAKCTFVRLSGCNLRCYKDTLGTLCDTPEALNIRCGKPMSAASIVRELLLLNNKIVCLTGGEPLMKDVTELLSLMVQSGFHVVIETNGSKSICEYRHFRNVSFIVDFKTRSTGENERMLEDNYVRMNEHDYLKFVINDEEDYAEMKEWMYVHLNFKGKIAAGLFWGSKIGYQELMKNVIEDRLPIELNMQTHKMMCLYDFYKCTSDFKDIFIPREL